MNFMGTYAPFENQNKFYVGSSVNQLFLNILNPYHPISWQKVTVTVESPTIPVPDSDEYYRGMKLTKEQYEYLTFYDVNSFVTSWGMPFREYLESKDSILYPMFIDLLNEAKAYIRYAWFQDELKFKKLVGLYIAHHLEIFMEVIKDVHNDRTFNVKVEDDTNTRHRKIEIGQEVMKNYDTTIYGRMFWKEYMPIAKRMSGLWGVI